MTPCDNIAQIYKIVLMKITIMNSLFVNQISGIILFILKICLLGINNKVSALNAISEAIIFGAVSF